MFSTLIGYDCKWTSGENWRWIANCYFSACFTHLPGNIVSGWNFQAWTFSFLWVTKNALGLLYHKHLIISPLKCNKRCEVNIEASVEIIAWKWIQAMNTNKTILFKGKNNVLYEIKYILFFCGWSRMEDVGQTCYI